MYLLFRPVQDIVVAFSGRGVPGPQQMSAELNLGPAAHIQAEQVHGNHVAVVRSPDDMVFPAADALVTACADTALFIRTADCVPIMLVDARAGAVGAVHSGLRGTLSSIVLKAIDTMKEHYGSRPEDIIAYIGPSISRCCYEVDEPVLGQIRQLPYYKKLVDPSRTGHAMLDLQLFNKELLIEKGVQKQNIIIAGLCTSCREDLFYSYRSRKDSERMYSMVVRQG